MARKRKAQKANNKLLPTFLIGVGITLFAIGTLGHFQLYSNLLIASKEAPKQVNINQIPSSISLPAVSLGVNIIGGGIINGNWVLSDTNALYLPTSGRVGEGYNTIIYAHNTPNLFGKLAHAKIGDVIYVKDKAGRVFEYKVYEKKDIEPYNLKGLYSKTPNIVTLFTCDGWFDSQRLVIRGKLINSSENTK